MNKTMEIFVAASKTEIHKKKKQAKYKQVEIKMKSIKF